MATQFPSLEKLNLRAIGDAVRRELGSIDADPPAIDVPAIELPPINLPQIDIAAARQELERSMANARTWVQSLTTQPNRALFGDLGPGSKADIGWLLKLDPNYQQRLMNDEFTKLHDAARAGDRKLPANKNDYAYLFIPGLFTEHYLGYMRDNMRRLRALGCEHVRKSAIDTDAGLLANAAMIKSEIEKLAAETGKQVILIGHSKGGVDAAGALELYPELEAHVKAFVSMQAPFAGTPIASDIGDTPALTQLMSSFIRDVFKGDPAALADLSYAARRAFIGDGVKFTARIPTYSFATSSSDAASLTALPSLYVRNRYGALNDGLVVRDDAIIPGSRGIIMLDGIDHSMPAMTGAFAAKRPGDITQALISMVLTA